MGVLPIRVEVGRYRNLAVEERICEICNTNEIEDELHFVMVCPVYNSYRNELLDSVVSQDFQLYNDLDKFIYLMKNQPKQVAKFIVKAIDLRKGILFQ